METVQNSCIQIRLSRSATHAVAGIVIQSPQALPATSLEELAQSIRAQGVLASLLVQEVEPERDRCRFASLSDQPTR